MLRNQNEFEGRNRQLPADLEQSRSYGPSAKARTDMQETPLGTPPDCYDVRSVFDVRPVNGFDFNITRSVFRTGDKDPPPINALVSFQVPDGLVCVLREIEIWFEAETAPGLNRSNVLISLQLNGGNYNYNTDMPVGTESGRIPVYMLADEFNTVGVFMRLTESFFQSAYTFFCWFHGNFLLKGVRPLPFEIANPSLDPKCVTLPPRTVPPPPAPPAPTVPPPSPIPIAPPAPVLRAPAMSIKNLLTGTGNRGRGGAFVVVKVPTGKKDTFGRTLAEERFPTNAEYAAHRLAFNAFISANKHFAPSLRVMTMEEYQRR